MPFYKKQPFDLVKKPPVKPQVLVFRFMEEIFRSYINKFSWTCKSTGKGTLTYEERLWNIPIEYVAIVVKSMMNLKDLVNSIAAKFQGPFSNGAEIYGTMDGHLHPCKIVKVIEDANKTQYEIEWLGTDEKKSKNELINGDDLTEKSVLHDNLAKKHGISTAPPDGLKFKISIQNRLVNPETQSIKYPMDDLLMQPTDDERLLVERPSPCKDFDVPMICVGKLFMVWDICTFLRLLNLYPFSLEDFENSICYKDIVPLLIVEASTAFLRLLVKDNQNFSKAIENKNEGQMITWTDYLCEFLETSSSSELSTHISTIKRGHYGLLEIHVKLEIFEDLIAHVLEMDTLWEMLDEYIEERQALTAVRREDALDEGRKKRKKMSREIHRLMKNKIKESIEMRSIKQRIEKRFIRASPLGKDKNYSRYWFFRSKGGYLLRALTPPSGATTKPKKRYSLINLTNFTILATIDALIGSLNPKGVRERALKKQLQKLYNKIWLIEGDSVQGIETEEAMVRRSTRVRAPAKEKPEFSSMKKKWKEIC
ncbi:hypothetical protein ACJIZ3_008945 [Penstemon smallii]|uniref:DDT domain-containing protein n=1 Tax=Penstemon smallii TaxID=265156 RepID=A0ABD3TB98_9LAMI